VPSTRERQVLAGDYHRAPCLLRVWRAQTPIEQRKGPWPGGNWWFEMARRKQTAMPALFPLSAVQPPYRAPAPEACTPAPLVVAPVDRPDRHLIGS